jgi:hypothetical protein
VRALNATSVTALRSASHLPPQINRREGASIDKRVVSWFSLRWRVAVWDELLNSAAARRVWDYL